MNMADGSFGGRDSLLTAPVVCVAAIDLLRAGFAGRPGLIHNQRVGRRRPDAGETEAGLKVAMVGETPEVEIYTDGSCSGNPGPGGWAAILVVPGKERELSGHEPETTNQRMEMKAAVEGLRALRRPCRVALYSDSAYLVNGLRQKWYIRWRGNGWRTSSGGEVKNRDLWEALLEELSRHAVEWKKVRGHSGHLYNERCDALARAATEKAREEGGQAGR